MKSRYYEAELAYLRERGREFARAFPSTAGLLAERSDDPDVERLLEGFAFLASRTRERVDDGMPELAQQLGAILVPQLTRFVPSCAIVQFEPDARAQRTATTLPRGTEVGGTAEDGTRCRFQLTQATTLLPLELVDVRAQQTGSRTEMLALRFRAPPHGVAAVGETPLRLYLHGDVSFALTLRAWFLHHCVEIAVYEGDTCRGKLWGPRRGLGFDADTRLLPEHPLEHDAFSSMAELLAFPQKFCFVELPPLQGLAAPELELRCTFEAPPELPRRVGKDDVRLHCAPVVNLFPSMSDPVRIEPLKPEGLVRSAERLPTESEVYAITGVTGSRQGRRVSYAPFTSYGAAPSSQASHDDVYYVTRRTLAISDTGTDLYVSLLTPRDAAPVAEAEVLSLDLLCSNRGAAASLGIGAIDQPVRGSPVFVPFKNITAPTPPLYPHHDVELLWRLCSHVGLSRRGLADADSLRRVLRAYNFAERSNAHQGRLAALWIESIREVQTRRMVRLHRGAPVTGAKTTVVLDESTFGGVGEAAAFGEALSEVFGRLVSLNSFDQLSVLLSPSQRKYTWAPRNGNIRLK